MGSNDNKHSKVCILHILLCLTSDSLFYLPKCCLILPRGKDIEVRYQRRRLLKENCAKAFPTHGEHSKSSLIGRQRLPGLQIRCIQAPATPSEAEADCHDPGCTCPALASSGTCFLDLTPAAEGKTPTAAKGGNENRIDCLADGLEALAGK